MKLKFLEIYFMLLYYNFIKTKDEIVCYYKEYRYCSLSGITTTGWAEFVVKYYI